MEFYLALSIALGMTVAAGVLYYYTMFLEAGGRQMRRRIAELERSNAALLAELSETRERVERAEAAHQSREVWPETLGEADPSSN